MTTARRLLVLAALGLGSAALAAPPVLLVPSPAFAQDKGGKDGRKGGGKDGGKDGDGGEKGDEPKDPKATPEWKACERIGADFAARNAGAIVARVHDDEKIRIALDDGKTDDYAAKQAKTVLTDWFRDRSNFSVKVKSVNGLGGRLEVSFDKAGSNRRETRTLLLTLVRRPKGGAFGLSRLELIS